MARLGQVVAYTLTEQDAAQINRRRGDASQHICDHVSSADGKQIHVGNPVEAGDKYPMVVTRLWPEGLVNGQVLLDGNDTFWVTSVTVHDEG